MRASTPPGRSFVPPWYPVSRELLDLGGGLFWSHDYEGAIQALGKISPLDTSRRVLAASLACLGRKEEGRAEEEKFLKEDPFFPVSVRASHAPFPHEKDRQHAVEGFLKASLRG